MRKILFLAVLCPLTTFFSANVAYAQLEETVSTKKQITRPGSIAIHVGVPWMLEYGPGLTLEAGYLHRINPGISLGGSAIIARPKYTASNGYSDQVILNALCFNTKVNLKKVNEGTRFTAFVIANPVLGRLSQGAKDTQTFIAVRPGFGLEAFSKNSKVSFNCSLSFMRGSKVVIQDPTKGGFSSSDPGVEKGISLTSLCFGTSFRL